MLFEPVLSPDEKLALVARAGTVLASSLDVGTTLLQVVNLVVPDVADWCGMLLLEPDGEEREISSGHEDSEVETVLLEIRRRRRETEGASESRRVAESGEPVLATDVRTLLADDVSASEREVIARLGRAGPKSYLIVPLTTRGRTLGSMTLLSTREGRHYTEPDLDFALTLAGRCATAIDNARLHAEAERSLALLDTVFSTAPVGMALVDRDLRLVRVNETFAAFNDRRVEELVGHTVPELLRRDGHAEDAMVSVYRHVLDTGEPILDQDVSSASPNGGGGERHWNVSFSPVRAAGGEVTGVIVVVVDVTERRALLDAEREARLRADFLARAGAILDASLDYEETLRAVAQIVVPDVADWCGVSILDESGRLEDVAVAHLDREQREIGLELNRRFPPDPDGTTGAVGVARSGRTEYVREVTDEMLAAGIPEPERLELVRRLGLRSVIIAALKARGRRFGTLTFANAESGRLFEQADVQLAEELAARAGMAIDNARLYTERSHIAHTLQTRLLPERLPQIPGLQVAARYRAAGEFNEVGGDFYDVFQRSPTEWALVVGDVSGKDAGAAAVTALARHTLRAAALEDMPPSGALRRLNTAMLYEDTAQFATVVLAYCTAADGDGLRVRLVLGGHPQPAVLRRDGTIEMVGRFGTMIGLHEDLDLHDVDVELGSGDVLLLYTDGVTEAGPRGAPFGDGGLAAVLEGLAGQTPQAIVDAVERAAVDAQPGDPRDDIALLAVTPHG